MPKAAKDERIVFRKQDRIGANDAEEDAEFLEECFVDTGDLDLLSDARRPERIVLGRTGSGKTALLLRLLETQERAIEVKPANLALSYISNSTILQFFEGAGVNLDPFYKLIWRHAFSVELLRARFELGDQGRFTLMDKVKAFFKGGQYSSAIKYLEHWGDKFWEETEHRVREITQKVEESLKSSLGGSIQPVELSAERAKVLSEEQRVDVVHRAQKVVNDAQVPQLNQILDLVRDVLDDDQKQYFIVIDRLDESWVEDQLRYKLIMALLDTVKEFRRVPNAKIVLALRIDLLQRVYKRARSAGFQEEKMESLYLRLRWSRASLVKMIDERVNHLFRDRYSKNRVLSCQDVMVESKKEVGGVEYILDRTFLRPRDVICFFNECIAKVEGRAKIALRDIKDAESGYSIGRLQSVADEWHAEYPNLILFAKALLAGAQPQGQVGAIVSEQVLQERCLSLGSRSLPEDNFSEVCSAVLGADRPCWDMMYAALSIFFRVGLIAIKNSPTETFAWHADTGRRHDATEFTQATSVQIHPMFWRALGVNAG
jgi:hypothetical protein